MTKEKQAYTKSFQKPIPVREVSLVSYRPYARQQAEAYLSQFIPSLLAGRLSTEHYSNKDLDIIGIV